MSVAEMMEYTFKSKYAGYNKKNKRRETWGEAVDRYCDMLVKKYNNVPKVTKYIARIRKSMKQKNVLGSQRGLQFGGDPILRKNARIYNCFGKETKFVSSTGVISFEDCYDGQELSVLTHTGKWQKGIVRNYGKQQLYKIGLCKTNNLINIRATNNHRWLLSDGSETTNLNVDDKLLKQKSIFENFDYDTATPQEKLYWCYGFTYGGGTITNNKYSIVRLCGHDTKYEYRFTELGFLSSTSLSLDGDIICFIGRYTKTSPDPNKDSPELIRAFVRGYLDADGTKNKNKDGRLFVTIQSSEIDHIEFIRKCFGIAGVFIISEEDLTGQETNFSVRPYTIRFQICDKPDAKTSCLVKVKSIELDNIEDVWCLEVENDNSFVLSSGVPTGNCTYSHVDRSRFFQEAMYLLLCGCGVGYSVQKHHVAKLPEVINRSGSKTYTIPDSIEGWADSIGICIRSFFPKDGEFDEYSGRNVKFDFSLISPAGTPLSSCRGKAPGPEPLMNAIDKITDIMKKAVGRQLKPIEVHDIICHFSDAVISGGVRRSALIALFSPDDEEMAKCKVGDWFQTNPQRGRANNSAVLLRDHTSYEDFANLIQSTREFGEPGFFWTDSLEFGTNPCVTIDTMITTKDGIKSVGSLLNNKFTAVVDGKEYLTKSEGFWKTGDKEVLELEFSSGRKLKVTPNHLIMTTNGWREAKDISFDDEIVVNKNRQLEYTTETQGYARGYLLGSFLSDGNSYNKIARVKFWGECKDEYRKDALHLFSMCGWKQSHNKPESDSKSVYSCIDSVELYKYAAEKGCVNHKHLSKLALECSWNELSGILAGYFDAGGTVTFNPVKGSSVRYYSSQIENLENIQIGLNALGIYSIIYKEGYSEGFRKLPDGNGGYKDYWWEATHELHISNDSIVRFAQLIRIRNKDKINNLQKIVNSYKRTPNRSKFIDKVVNKTNIGVQEVYDVSVEDIEAFDANGIYVHNCAEICFYPYFNGKSGWQGCNLSTINVAKIKTRKDYFRFARDAAIIGTLQAGFNSFPYLGEVSEKIFQKEALLGVSMTGIMEMPEITLNEENQRIAAEIVKRTNAKIAKLIGINQSARTTCVKPEGTSSCILGTCSGIHPHHAKRYIRRIQSNKNEPLYKFFKSQNPAACEESIWSANDSDDVISFCIEVPDGAKTKNQISAIELLKIVQKTQQNWVTNGRNIELCTDSRLNHNVSNTVTVQDYEWNEVIKYIYDNRNDFCGISLLSASGDKDYYQAPFSTVLLPHEQITLYGDAALFASGLIEGAKELWEDNLWGACDALLGISNDNKGLSKKQWLGKALRYATRYLGGDIKKLTYCLKDVDTYKKYIDLKREFQKVDYNQFIEEEDNTDVQQEAACSGGTCELIR